MGRGPHWRLIVCGARMLGGWGDGGAESEGQGAGRRKISVSYWLSVEEGLGSRMQPWHRKGADLASGSQQPALAHGSLISHPILSASPWLHGKAQEQPRAFSVGMLMVPP